MFSPHPLQYYYCPLPISVQYFTAFDSLVDTDKYYYDIIVEWQLKRPSMISFVLAKYGTIWLRAYPTITDSFLRPSSPSVSQVSMSLVNVIKDIPVDLNKLPRP